VVAACGRVVAAARLAIITEMATALRERVEPPLLPPFAGGSWPQELPAGRFGPRDLERLPVAARGPLAGSLRRLGLTTVGRLLEHLPRSWTAVVPIGSAPVGGRGAFAVRIRRIGLRQVGSVAVVEALVADRSGVATARFFNQPWLVRRYRPGSAILLEGRVVARGAIAVSRHRPLRGRPPALLPSYPAGAGATPAAVAAAVADRLGALRRLGDPLPARLRLSLGLPSKGEALQVVHRPAGAGELALARRRLAFEELFLLQLRFLAARRRLAAARAPALPAAGLARRWLARLPFAPTAEQLAACAQIDRDLLGTVPMRRLLVGEVGSGKTLVAVYALLRAVEAGFQGALLVPTEALARQHLATLERLAAGWGVPFALLCGSTPRREREEVIAGLADGRLAVVVGTHALLGEGVSFANLGLVVYDEQHRFGVRQRQLLLEKAPDGTVPHALHLSATPIPRSLALALHGDLDLSLIRRPPAGRPGVRTFVGLAARLRPFAYRLVRSELAAGRRAFVVCPRVEEGAGRAARREFVRLAEGELAGFAVGLLHGRLDGGQQAELLARFAAGELQALVATTVIEVGIDVPEATVVIVEEAERFGLSQLHQLRGRVGRGRHRGWCFLLAERPQAAGRLKPLARLGDGFALAYLDLKERGRGELVGTRQSGHPRLAVARLPEDRPLLLEARRQAQAVVGADPQLASPRHLPLRQAVEERYGGWEVAAA